MSIDLKASIPERSFGHCQWCDSDSVSLTYLMCPSCYRISNMAPSKAMVLMNSPVVKKKLATLGVSVRSITPYVREYIFDPSSKFPTEESDKEHWAIMIENAPFHANQDDVRLYVEQLMDLDVKTLPTKEEAQEKAGIEVMIRFMLLVGIVRGVLKMKTSDEDIETFTRICQEAASVAAQNRADSSGAGLPIDDAKPAAKRTGMHIHRDGR